MALREYDPNKVTCDWGGIDLTEGFAQGDFFTDSENAPRFVTKSTGRRGIVRTRRSDTTGTITLTVDQESNVHQQLLVRAALDDNAGTEVYPLILTDKSTEEVITYTSCIIQEVPGQVRSTEAQTVAWVLGYAARKALPNTSDQNLVG